MGAAAAVVIALALSGCATPSGSSTDQPNEGRRAAETNTALGRQYLERKQYEVALEKLKRAVAHDKTYAPAHTVLGVLYETLGQYDQAGDEYRLAVRYDPKNGDVNNNYAVFLCSRGKGRDAEEYFEAAARDPFYKTPEVTFANAGLCSLGLGDLDKAEKYLRQSLEYDAEFAPALLPMARVSYERKSYLNARAFLQRYEAVGKANAESLFLGFRIEQALGDGEAAGRYRQDLLDSFPNSAQAATARKAN